jgi:hypothetical protein
MLTPYGFGSHPKGTKTRASPVEFALDHNDDDNAHRTDGWLIVNDEGINSISRPH